MARNAAKPAAADAASRSTRPRRFTRSLGGVEESLLVIVVDQIHAHVVGGACQKEGFVGGSEIRLGGKIGRRVVGFGRIGVFDTGAIGNVDKNAVRILDADIDSA